VCDALVSAVLCGRIVGVSVVAVIFWAAVGLLIYTQLGYPLVLLVIAPFAGHRPNPALLREEPTVALIVAAHNEAVVIATKVANALALDWPRDRLEIIVCADGCSDATAALARTAGADQVLELDRCGKIPALDAGVAATTAELVVFSDANVALEPGALRELAGAFADPTVGYACGQVQFVQASAGPAADNQEGLYWRYEMAIRTLESRVRSVTAGNGGIHATRRDSYIVIDPRMDHDICFPFSIVKRGRLALYVPAARGVEKMVPSIDGEFARKRRFMSHVWTAVLAGGMLSPRGYGLRYALMIFSHRVLRYSAPKIHIVAFASNAVLLGSGWVYVVCFGAQLVLLGAAAAAGVVRLRVLLVARYYVAMNAAILLGLWDYLRRGTPLTWESPEGTR
jgi:cellulose synthase/poly-beta-1,6-N-acetylglucosamine synthase-like glycosyltransferase